MLHADAKVGQRAAVPERVASCTQRDQEAQAMTHLDTLQEMSLGSLLYYVLVGDGRIANEQ
jgi:hypothetical protein